MGCIAASYSQPHLRRHTHGFEPWSRSKKTKKGGVVGKPLSRCVSEHSLIVFLYINPAKFFNVLDETSINQPRFHALQHSRIDVDGGSVYFHGLPSPPPSRRR